MVRGNHDGQPDKPNHYSINPLAATRTKHPGNHRLTFAEQAWGHFKAFTSDWQAGSRQPNNIYGTDRRLNE